MNQRRLPEVRRVELLPAGHQGIQAPTCTPATAWEEAAIAEQTDLTKPTARPQSSEASPLTTETQAGRARRRAGRCPQRLTPQPSLMARFLCSTQSLHIELRAFHLTTYQTQ